MNANSKQHPIALVPLQLRKIGDFLKAPNQERPEALKEALAAFEAVKATFLRGVVDITAQLQRAADVATLDEARRLGYRVTLELEHTDTEGFRSTGGWAVVYVRPPTGKIDTKVFRADTDEPLASEDEARREAACWLRSVGIGKA